MKEVQFTILLEAELCDSFAEAAKTEGRPADQIVREFMRDYVSRVRERDTVAVKEVISASERKRRQDAVTFAMASVGLEGFKHSKEDEERAQRFIAGEIDLAEYLGAAPSVDQLNK
ncbi:antitoxin VbhA family protein [Massilia pseudoviolaceinigra]|uniref:antitoxin VbhA family protein n=1 Tax=Massilia pseudoviolaceinigra TaxID=3057165 RepID=UPI0027969B07|nr:antitoxin VbhA family protein [Massilia sp. CCM 9206]MDQ1919324.1 antitoxin VbhA family protein [Massilia sp. CCM 9206]